MQKFQKDDIVRLITGSHNMTVEGYEHNIGGAFSNYIDKKEGKLPKDFKTPPYTNNVICVWTEGTESKKAKYHQDLLEKV